MNADVTPGSAFRVLRARSPGLAWTDTVCEGLPPALDWVALSFDPDAPSFTQHGARSPAEPLSAESLDAEPAPADPAPAHPTPAEPVEAVWLDPDPAYPEPPDPPLHPTSPHTQPKARSPKPEAQLQAPFETHDPTRLTATNLAASLPPAMVEAAAEAHARGEPTFFAAIQLLLAVPDWLSELRATTFRAAGPWPQALMLLLDAAGVDGEIHRGHADRVRRLAARLPIWARRRGQLDVARDLARQAGVDASAWSRPAQPRDDELFVCHDAAWWRARGAAGSAAVGAAQRTEAGPEARSGAASEPVQDLRISAGYLQFQPRSGPVWALLPEDVAVTVDAEVPGTPAPRVVRAVERDQVVGRLLPVWAVVRPALVPARATRTGGE